MSNFDAKRAMLKRLDVFKRFKVSGEGVSLRNAGLKPNAELLVFQRGSERRGLLRRQMVYHHAAQGELAGEPYLISF